MAEHRIYGPRDEVDEPIGDEAFAGVNDRVDPRKLPEGLCAAATNKSFARGYAETRPGWMTPSWGGPPCLNFDPDYDGVEEGLNFDPDGDGTEEGVNFAPAGFGEVFGVAQFSDPNGQEATLIAVEAGVWRVRNFSEPEMIYLPDRAKITGTVRFVQAFDRVLMFRGEEQTPLVWNPSEDFSAGIGTWEEIVEAAPGTGTFLLAIPNGKDALCFQNRVWVLTGKDQYRVSDILDYTHYDPIMAVLRINAGTDDEIIRGVAYGEQAIVVLKRRSGYVLRGTFGTSDTLAFTLTSDRLPGCMGCVGRNAVAEGGTDLFFLGDGGIYEIGQTTESKLQSDPAPISAAIEGTMKRVHWMYAGNAQMVCHEDRLFCAVPLDGATYNNAILVYNLTTKQWEGTWTAAWLRLVAFVQVVEDGRKKLGFVNGTGGELRMHWWAELSDEAQVALGAANVQFDLQGLTDGALCVMGCGKQDYVYGYSSWIEDEILTRGYKLAPMQQTKGLRLTLDLETWNPRFDVFVRRAGRSTEDRVANDVRRGFECSWGTNLLTLNTTADGDALASGTREFDGYTIGSPVASWGKISEFLFAPGFATDVTMYQTGKLMDVRCFSRFRFRGVVFPSVAPGATLSLVVTITDEDTGLSESFTVGTYTSKSGTEEMLDVTLYPGISMLRYPLVGKEWTVSFDGSGTGGTGLIQLNLENANSGHCFEWSAWFEYYNSRRQRIFGAEEVLWTEGCAPADINIRGHDDYAWRIDAGIGNGVVLGGTERYPHVYRLTKRGEFVQARVANIRGYSALHGVALHGQVGRRGKGDRAG